MASGLHPDASPIMSAIERVADRLHEVASCTDLASVAVRTAALRDALDDALARLGRLGD